VFIPVVVTTIVFVVFVAPVAISMPSLAIGIPPPVTSRPAVFAGFREVMTRTIGFGTAIPMVLDSLVKAVVGAINAFLTVVFISTQAGGCA
jgi:hypothetical protein